MLVLAATLPTCYPCLRSSISWSIRSVEALYPTPGLSISPSFVS